MCTVATNEPSRLYNLQGKEGEREREAFLALKLEAGSVGWGGGGVEVVKIRRK